MIKPSTHRGKAKGRGGLASSPRRITTLTASAGIALTVVAAGPSAIATASKGADARYVAPATNMQHGALLSAKPLQLKSFANTKAWSITYRSTSATGRPDTVSGAVLVPTASTPHAAPKPTPIVAYAPGTWGLGDQCAPSRHLDSDAESEQWYIQKYTSMGYAVATTDYEGLGTPGLPTYNVGPSEGHAVLDVVRAALKLPGSDLSADAPVAVVGYSQGGLAAGWTAELAPTYAPEINLKAAAIGAPPGDLAVNLRYLDGTAWASLEFAAIAGQNAAYPQLHLERYLNAAGRAMFKQLATECVLQAAAKWAGHHLSEYTTSDFLNRPDWRASVHQSLLGTTTPRVPVLLYNSPTDEIVPFGPAARLRDTWRTDGADVTFYTPDTGGHGVTGVKMAAVAAGWISERLLGLPPIS